MLFIGLLAASVATYVHNPDNTKKDDPGASSGASGASGITAATSATPENDHIVEKTSETLQVELIERPKDELGELKAKVHYEDRPCEGDNWYGGIGVNMLVLFSDVGSPTLVSYVWKNYPAEKMGVKIGDKLLDENNVRGVPGTKIVLPLLRDGHKIVLEGVREKICTEKNEIKP